MRLGTVLPHISPIIWLTLASAAGWMFAVVMWLRSESRHQDHIQYVAVILGCAWLGAAFGLRKNRIILIRVLVFLAIGTLIGLFLGPNISDGKGFAARAAEFFQNPFSFPPTRAVVATVVAGIIGYFLPPIRRGINWVNQASPNVTSMQRNKSSKRT
jgi:hypothetical protein